MAHLIISSKDISTLDGLYSLNDLHKAAGAESRHQPSQFLRNHHTKELIAEIDTYRHLTQLNGKSCQRFGDYCKYFEKL